MGDAQFIYLVGRVGIHRKAVQRHGVFRRLGMKRFDAVANFRRFDWAGGVAEVGGLALKRGEARAGAAAGDLDFHVGVLTHVNLGPFLGENNEVIGTFDGDVTGEGMGGEHGGQ